MTGFRKLYAAEVPMRVIDLGFHVLLAYLLPGPWWSQFLPDALTALLFVHGLATDRFLPSSHPLLHAHRFLHLRGPVGFVGVFLLIACALLWPGTLPFVVQWLAHVAVDSATHTERWQ